MPVIGHIIRITRGSNIRPCCESSGTAMGIAFMNRNSDFTEFLNYLPSTHTGNITQGCWYTQEGFFISGCKRTCGNISHNLNLYVYETEVDLFTFVIVVVNYSLLGLSVPCSYLKVPYI